LPKSDIHVLSAIKLSPFYEPLVREQFIFHDRLHEIDPKAFAAIAPQIRGIAGSGESKVSGELIAQCPNLEIISVFGVGYDGVDVAAAKAKGVMVTHTPNVLNDDVADLAIGLMLSAARQLPQADRYVREGRWAEIGPMPLARKVSGAKLGIVGMGRIGQAIAQRALAFNMSVAYTTRSPKSVPFTHVPNVVDLARQSDYLIVITPGGAATRHLINAEVLAALGPEGILVNVARGSVVDEAALIDALERKVIAGAGLDVFQNEPHVPEALRAVPHVVLAPHIGSATSQTRKAMGDLAFANLQAHFEGRPVITPVPECQ